MNKLSASALIQVSKNSFFLLLARAVDFLAQICIIPVIVRYLGPEQYGDYGYVMSFAFIATSFTYMGLERIVMREIARNPSDAAKYLGAGIIVRWIYMAVAVLFAAILVLFMHLSAKIILPISIALLALSFSADAFIYLATFKAFNKMRYEALLTFMFQCFNLTFVFLTVYFRFGFTAFFIGLLMANIARYIFARIIARRKLVTPQYNNAFALVKLLLKESYILCLVSLIIQVFINVDVILLKNLKGAFDTAMFYAPHNLLILMSLIPISIMSGFFPALSRSADTDFQVLLYKYEKIFKIFTIIGVFLTAMGIVLAGKIIPLLYGNQFTKAIYCFQILSVSFVFTMLFSVVDFTLVAIKKQNALIWCFIAALTVRVILDFILIPKYGYIGASIAAVGGYIVVFVIGFLVLSRYAAFLPIHKIVFKPVVAVGLIGFVLYQFHQANMYLLSVIGVIFYVLFLLGMKSFMPDEIDFLKRAIRKVSSSL